MLVLMIPLYLITCYLHYEEQGMETEMKIKIFVGKQTGRDYYVYHADDDHKLSFLMGDTYNQFLRLDSMTKFDDYIVDSPSNTCVVRVIYDLLVNITTIVDDKEKYCFIMPNTSVVLFSSTPHFHMKTMTNLMPITDYSIKINLNTTELEKFMRNMILVKPSINNVSAYGLYTYKTCARYTTFNLKAKKPIKKV
ncbi:Hypothetical protein CINCED_3A009482 [Cinara cedri]|uniref:Uncharacterized protein n=1 Tax=Cinara cedri TaxID=506608 RepID=A0A5E4NJE3_9HEMI|nr:Hypothetical protein CINCED_3A009482 [Cinara cedri]